MSSKTYFCLPYLVYIEISSRTINDVCNFMLIERVNAQFAITFIIASIKINTVQKVFI